MWVCCKGLGARSVVNFSWGGGGGPLCVEVPVTLFRVYLGMVTYFWSTFVLGGGGGNVTFHGIYMGFPRELLYHWCQLCTYGPP